MPFPSPAHSSADGTDSLASFNGSLKPFVTANAVVATGPGAVADFGSAVNNVLMALTGTATSAQVDIEGSMDGATNWFKLKTDTAAAVTTPRIVVTSLQPCRYVRGNVISLVGGNVTAQLMACD